MKELSPSERSQVQRLREAQRKHVRGTPEWELYQKMISSITNLSNAERPKPKNL